MEARASEVFVGRAGELGELERALDAARAGTGATVLVAGEAGIGKTRLASELASACPRCGVRGPARPLDRSGRYGAALPAVRRGVASARGALAGRRAGAWLAAAGVRGDAGAAHRVRRFRTGAARARGPALGRYLDARSGRLPRAQPRRPAGSARSRPAGQTSPRRPARMRRLAEGVRRSGSALILELGPLGRDELGGAARGPRRRSRCPRHWRTRSPPAPRATLSSPKSFSPRRACRACELPEALRDLLLQRVARLDHPTQSVLRLAAAAGREVGYPLLRATAGLPDGALRDSLRAAVEGGVLVAEPETGSFRFRHALLAEAIYATILPGEREELHARLAEELARSASGGGGRARRRTGRRRAVRPRRSRRRSKPRARPRRSSVSRRLTRISSGRSRSGPRCRTRPGSPGLTSPNSAPGRPSSPARSAPARGRSSSHGGRSTSSARKTRTARRSSTCRSVSTSTRPGRRGRARRV